MSLPSDTVLRNFQTYSGVRLPLRLVGPLDDHEIGHRNTYVRAFFDSHDRLVGCDKMVYGEVQLSHRYRYYPDGVLKRAEITMDGETTVMAFDTDGQKI